MTIVSEINMIMIITTTKMMMMLMIMMIKIVILIVIIITSAPIGTREVKLPCLEGFIGKLHLQ